MHHLRDIQERLTKDRQQQEADRYKYQKCMEYFRHAAWVAKQRMMDRQSRKVIIIPPAHVHRDTK